MSSDDQAIQHKYKPQDAFDVTIGQAPEFCEIHKSDRSKKSYGRVKGTEPFLASDRFLPEGIKLIVLYLNVLGVFLLPLNRPKHREKIVRKHEDGNEENFWMIH